MVNLVGQKFGMLTVLQCVGTHRNSSQLWECSCDYLSGKLKTTTTDNLKQGDTRSCGCMRGTKAVDLTGQTFGKLFVLRRAGSTPTHQALWLCQCNCGDRNTTILTSYRLTSGTTKSCGCGQGGEQLNLAGQKYGKLTVLKQTRNGHWERQCDCPDTTIKIVPTKLLRAGNTTSCGCLTHKPRAKDITGLRSGKLVVLRRSTKKAPGKSRSAMWVTQCDCDPSGERLKSYPTCLLTAGKQGSCGCASLNGEIVRTEEARQAAQNLRNRRYGSDLKYTLNVRTRALIRQILKNRGAYKTRSPLKNLDYSIEDLEKHLLSTMPASYTWQDFMDGTLHIDHRRPIALFEFTADTDPGFREAWALDNLQLLTADHNRAKRDRTDWTP